ncbi:DUF1697 domain-containing protein [Oerskovia flava]|uniref:DUF1697 domain-containing protein n=1 Tax=Oerskovia flava TaxID=2986422 RepID=UPI00223E9170|nr:DUF1697 domain-containing protein [Oerskovia sp. JB1-3-2]
MTTSVVLLLGVNVGGRRVVRSQTLRQVATDAGFTDPRTHLASGNLVAGTGDASPAEVSARIRSGLLDALGLDVHAVTLSATRIAGIVTANPYPEAARDDPAHLLVLVGTEEIDAEGVARLVAEHPGRERATVVDGVLYVTYPDGIGRSRLTSAVLARAASTALTARNWTTITRLAEMAGRLPG